MLKLILKEIRFRKINSLLLFLSISLAVLLVSSTRIIIDQYRQAIHYNLLQKEKDLEKEMHTIWNDYRKITLGLGFNVLILPKNQNLSDFYADDFASEYMPEKYATILADSDIITVQHILPTLLTKTTWPEEKRSVLVYGVLGEIPRQLLKKQKKPLIEAVARDNVVLGYELWNSLGINKGDKISFRNNVFTVQECHNKRGNRDDISMWLHLNQAQKIFNRQGEINSILALECRCKSAKNMPNIAHIRKDLENLLPETQAIEYMTDVVARAEARYNTVTLKEESFRAEKAHKIALFKNREKIAIILISIVIGTCLIAVGFLAYVNMRKRRYEIGILRALGIQNKRLVPLLLGKIFIIGVAAALFGMSLSVVFGWIAGLLWRTIDITFPSYYGILALIMLLVTPISGLIAAWFPILKALHVDPSAIIKEA